MLYAYADQNFLSHCIDHPQWTEVLVSARQKRLASIVLSPLHFYEFGNARPELKERFLQLVEVLEPTWARSPADEQLAELVGLWCKTWNAKGPQVHPLCTLNEVLAAMHRRPPAEFVGVNLRDIVAAFQGSAQEQLRKEMSKQEHAANQNRLRFKQTGLTRSMLNKIDTEHVAVQLARWTKDENPTDVLLRAHRLRTEQPTATYIECFIYWQLHKDLRSYQVESIMSEQLWFSTAALDLNRFVDRMHALVALPLCQVFLTDDKDLTKRCEYVRARVSSQVARLSTAAEFIDHLSEAGMSH